MNSDTNSISDPVAAVLLIQVSITFNHHIAEELLRKNEVVWAQAIFPSDQVDVVALVRTESFEAFGTFLASIRANTFIERIRPYLLFPATTRIRSSKPSGNRICALFRVEPGYMQEPVFERISQIPEVYLWGYTYGNWDIVCEINYEDENELGQTIYSITEIRGIESSASFYPMPPP